MLDITFQNRTTEDKFRAFIDNAFDLSILRPPSLGVSRWTCRWNGIWKNTPIAHWLWR